jgi:DNA-directed RNA polymerase II subunit RPB2
MSEINNDVAWKLIGLYFKRCHLERLVRHQIDSYNYFVNHQMEETIEMFNPIKIRSENDYVPEVNKHYLEINLNLTNMKLHRPQIHENNGATSIMLPHEARLRNFTYSSSTTIDLDIEIIIREGADLSIERKIKNVLKNVHIGKMPIMLKSSICGLTHLNGMTAEMTGECKYDAGGYFIINGSEKIVLGQERVAENTIFCFPVKQTTKWLWTAEIKSVPDYKQISPKQINIMISSKNNGFGYGIYVQLARLKAPVPLYIMFRALGVLSDKDITSYILLNIKDKKKLELFKALEGSVVDANNIMTQEDAILYIIGLSMYTPMNMSYEQGKQKKRTFTVDILGTDMFPHCKSKKKKLYFLGYMVNRLLETYLGWRESDDRDSYQNKRIDTVGVLLNNLFRNYLNKMVKDIQKTTIREINTGSWKSSEDYINIINTTNIYKIVKSPTIENGIKRALATGDFGIKQINQNKVGVAQVLNRMTYIATLSHLRRINTPIDKSGKLIPPRKLHNTTYGYLCPAETPEGPSVGVVKNLSYMTLITINSYSASLYDYVKEYITDLDNIDNSKDNNDLYERAKVIINGSFEGFTNDPITLYHVLKEKKRQGVINIYVSIVFDYKNKEIIICNDGGRLVRPLLTVKNNKLNLTHELIEKIKTDKLDWNDLLTNHKIDNAVLEYIDPREQNSTMISMHWNDLSNSHLTKYEYCEIHPSTLFGILASCIPFPEHNQSPRNTYQCAMGKQAMGVYVTNYHNRTDKTSFVLSYPMRPLVDTRIMNILKLHEIPSGANVIVAIMTHTGYNQEDSILFNKGSIDRGLFQATIYHTEKDEEKKIYGDEEIRGIPEKDKTKGIKFGNYSKVNKNGVIDENTLIQNQDIIIGKYVPIKENKNDSNKKIKYEDQSRSYKTSEETYVEKNYINRNGDGYNFCKVKLRTLRQPVIGDKFSSRHGQKGTIGNIISEEDMPFTENGLKPDIIINPHAIPSRMTIAQLKETLLGKVLLELGLYGDGTSFGNLTVDDMCNELCKIGYESKGNEVLYNGTTGEQIDSHVYIGPCFYQRLKHMVVDKQHSRSIGPMVSLTRQPAEGRSRDGGLRCGEMERDGLICHGMANMTKDRLYNCSDKYSIYVCGKCGMQVSYNKEREIHYCMLCENRTKFSKVNVPYSYKLLTQELITMNIAARYITE